MSYRSLVPDTSSIVWRFYVDLCTRITTRPLPDGHGDEREALDSLYTVFTNARYVLENTKNKKILTLVIKIMEFGIRPFITKWHTEQKNDRLDVKEFRKELRNLQMTLKHLTKELGEEAGFFDLITIADNCLSLDQRCNHLLVWLKENPEFVPEIRKNMTEDTVI